MAETGSTFTLHARTRTRRLAVGLALAAGCVAGGIAVAEEVRILRSDGSDVTGVLTSFEDGVYVVATPQGEVRVEVGKVSKMEVLVTPPPAASAKPSPDSASPAPSPPPVAAAGPVTINSTVTITTTDKQQFAGRLVSFEDGFYEIETPAGIQRLAIANVIAVEPGTAAAAPAPASSAAIAAAAAIPPVDLAGGSLIFSGSRSLGEMAVRQLIEAYALRNGAAKPVWGQRNAGNDRTFATQTGKDRTFTAEVKLRGTAGGVEDLISGAADIAMLERPMTADEAKRVAAAGLGDPLQPGQETIIGPSAVVVLVHPTNPVKRLSMAQLNDILAGRIRNWNEVGGSNRRIQLLVPQPGSAIFDGMQAGMGKALEISPSARRVSSSLEAADLVGADPAAIGLAHSDYRGNAWALSLTTACGLTFEPNAFQIASEAYPFGSRLVLYTTAKASKQVHDFLNYAQSSEAQQLLQDKGFVSLTPVLSAKGAVKFDRVAATKMTGASARFGDVVGAFVESAARLTLTFRFDAQGAALDARGQSDLNRLAEYAKSGALGNRTLSLVGYWDSTGDFADDVSQSKARAVMVAGALKQKGLNIERLFGFGPLLPVECEGAGAATYRNRRVEVWVE